jgi:hypothetical protein
MIPLISLLAELPSVFRSPSCASITVIYNTYMAFSLPSHHHSILFSPHTEVLIYIIKGGLYSFSYIVGYAITPRRHFWKNVIFTCTRRVMIVGPWRLFLINTIVRMTCPELATVCLSMPSITEPIYPSLGSRQLNLPSLTTIMDGARYLLQNETLSP